MTLEDLRQRTAGANRKNLQKRRPNAFLKPDYQGVQRRLMPIADRSISSLIRPQGIGDLYQIYALCKRNSIHFCGWNILDGCLIYDHPPEPGPGRDAG